MILDNIANILLWFTRETFIVPFLILGYIWGNKHNFYHATCLILLSMLFNYALKITFAVPLNPAIGKGFAFPSGHMQQAVTFFGWLAIHSNNIKICGSTIILLIGIGLSLVHFGYHNYYDILGALFFGTASIIGYLAIINKNKFYTPWIIIFIASTLLIYIYFSKEITMHIWMAFCTLCGFMTSCNIFDFSENNSDRHIKLLKTILCFTTLTLIILTFSMKEIKNLIPMNAKWFLIGFTVPYISSLKFKLNH